jgi:hypothetical protein
MGFAPVLQRKKLKPVKKKSKLIAKPEIILVYNGIVRAEGEENAEERKKD